MKGKFADLVNKEQPVLVDFYADWCGPCQMMSPILKEVAQELGDQVKIIKIDVDKNQPLAQQFGVRSIPTLILFKNGKVVSKKAGLLTKRDLTSFLKSAV